MTVNLSLHRHRPTSDVSYITLLGSQTLFEFKQFARKSVSGQESGLDDHLVPGVQIRL